MERIAIVMPAHNEEERIGPTLKEYLDFFLKIKKNKVYDFEIIVVINNCKDNTRKVVEKFKCKELKIIEFVRGGKGFAVTEGFKEALKGNFDLIGFVDADLATPAFAFYDLIKNIKDYDGVIANRWDKRSDIKTKQTWFRRCFSIGFNFIVRTLFFLPHRDTQCGAKVFRADSLRKVVPMLGASEWSFDVDLLFYMRRIGARVKSIPTTWEDKKGSKINIKRTPARMFFSVVRLRLYHSPFKFLIRAHSKLPEKWKVGNIIDRIK